MPEEENTAEEASPAPEKTLLDLQGEIEALNARVVALESMAHNEHSIPPTTIDSIIKQAVQRVGRHLRTTSDILSVLEQ